MALKLTRFLRKQICVTSSAATAVGNLVLNVYSGTVPTNAESPLSGNTKLVSYKNGAVYPAFNLVLEYDDVAEAMVPVAGQVLTGTAVATNTATFFRLELATDDGLSDAVDQNRPRIQGTVGSTNQDMFMGNTAITSGDVKTLGGFALQLLSL